MIQTFIDLFPDFVNEYGLLGCTVFTLSCVAMGALFVSMWRGESV